MHPTAFGFSFLFSITPNHGSANPHRASKKRDVGVISSLRVEIAITVDEPALSSGTSHARSTGTGLNSKMKRLASNSNFRELAAAQVPDSYPTSRDGRNVAGSNSIPLLAELHASEPPAIQTNASQYFFPISVPAQSLMHKTAGPPPPQRIPLQPAPSCANHTTQEALARQLEVSRQRAGPRELMRAPQIPKLHRVSTMRFDSTLLVNVPDFIGPFSSEGGESLMETQTRREPEMNELSFPSRVMQRQNSPSTEKLNKALLELAVFCANPNKVARW
jgi:hypothetical protein